MAVLSHQAGPAEGESASEYEFVGPEKPHPLDDPSGWESAWWRIGPTRDPWTVAHTIERGVYGFYERFCLLADPRLRQYADDAIRELVTNATVHADGTHASITLWYDWHPRRSGEPTWLRVAVHDRDPRRPNIPAATDAAARRASERRRQGPLRQTYGLDVVAMAAYLCDGGFDVVGDWDGRGKVMRVWLQIPDPVTEMWLRKVERDQTAKLHTADRF
ncbi:ATP-binding protein [Streptomyces sp. SID3343]|uniref:ATP-binding protein n=1 Tax=Streptomyces sp. SID3343 TaxID=2690260 RepID=UPI001369BA8D|nr:ATP-binding protein [Streptomyces sp. SID3343]MYV99235.1 hypothetical protein [Streptomyces sp. SID3343]